MSTLGSTIGSQSIVGLVYASDGGGGAPGTLLCTTGQITVSAGMAAARKPYVTHEGPLFFAHRGGARLSPENTLAAFERGEALGLVPEPLVKILANVCGRKVGQC